MHDYQNGSLKLKEVIENHSGKLDILENVIVDGFNKLHDVTDKGLGEVANEIRALREVGAIPTPIVEKMLEHNNKLNEKNSDKTFKVLLIMTSSGLAIFLGLKAFFPHLLGG